LVGLWQIPQGWVWIKIDPDGSALQCRAGSNIVLASRGHLSEDSREIRWEYLWGTDEVLTTARTLRLAGRFHAFKFKKVGTPINDACLRREAYENPLHEVPLEQAKRLIEEGSVQSIHQPHFGLVDLKLRSGETVRFQQPYMDWVWSFVTDNGLGDRIDSLEIE
jgi:hypothetical protein